MKNLWIPATAAMAVLLSAGCKKQETDMSSTRTTSATEETQRGSTTSNTTLSNDDKEFVTKAAQGGLLEVDLGREVATKGNSPEVRAFGHRMVSDHSKSNEELKQLAAKKGVTLPMELDKDHKEKLDKLSKLSGDKLDKEYADDMVDDHEDDVKEFRKAASDLKDPELRAWAAKTLPTLEQHLNLARTIDAKMKR